MGHQVGNGIDIVKIKQKSLMCKLRPGKSCFSISVSDTELCDSSHGFLWSKIFFLIHEYMPKEIFFLDLRSFSCSNKLKSE